MSNESPDRPSREERTPPAEVDPEALADASASFDPADMAVEPAAVVPEGEAAEGSATAKESGSSTLASAMVAAGIFLSRIAGLIRVRVFAQYFGTTIYADVFNAAVRLPNLLQNMLGEGTLSASFIPVYSELLHEGRKEEAGRVAGAIFALLLAVAGALALIGIFLAPVLVSVFLAGFEGERRELTITVTRILFPMAGMLVLSAWSLGILNSHRFFFLSYFAPVLWNAAMIATLLLFGDTLSMERLVIALAWGALLGGALQFLVQLPGVLKMERSLRINWGTRLEGVREAVRNAGPAIMGRGVVQIGGWIDIFLASFLAAGAVAVLQYAQTLYILPISLFGMSVAAAELPELSRRRTGAEEELRRRASAGLERIAFYVVPSFVGFLALGDVIVAGIFQTGEFDPSDTIVTYLTLAGFAIGLLATTASRMLSSTFFALRDTRTPARFAMVRMLLAAALGVVLMLQFESVAVDFDFVAFTTPAGVFGDWRIGGTPLGPVGLALGSGIAAWLEWALLKRALRNHIGAVGAGAGAVGRMLAAAAAGAAAGWGVRLLLPGIAILPWLVHPITSAVLIVGTFGVTYFAVAALLGLEQSSALFRRIGRILGR